MGGLDPWVLFWRYLRTGTEHEIRALRGQAAEYKRLALTLETLASAKEAQLATLPRME